MVVGEGGAFYMNLDLECGEWVFLSLLWDGREVFLQAEGSTGVRMSLVVRTWNDRCGNGPRSSPAGGCANTRSPDIDCVQEVEVEERPLVGQGSEEQ